MVVCAQVADVASGCKKYRLASKVGVLLSLYRPGELRALQNATPLLRHGLDGVVMERLREFPCVSLLGNMRKLSRVGNGQGMLRCSC